MSLDPSANLQIFSPAGSGRSSPSPRATRHNTEEALQKKNKSFRRYAATVERALALWDAAQQEWADYISFLQRLLKALQSNTNTSEVSAIPHSEIVALRLSQCLNPNLPSGVHQKALEVYGYIFSRIEVQILPSPWIGNLTELQADTRARDLNLYFPGLAPVLSFASLSIRPLFLSLMEEHVLTLKVNSLRPALKAIILCFLPGLEDETSEDFERIVSCLDRLHQAVGTLSHEPSETKSQSGSSHFWQCFFLATITNSSRRQGALAYLIRRLPKFGVTRRDSQAQVSEDLFEKLPASSEAAITPEPGLLIRCFEAGLTNTQLLIQRGFLDMLVTHLPLDSPVLQQRIAKEDLERLVGAAAGVVSRRDMSLNRRLWSWLLGPEPPNDAHNSEVSSPVEHKGSGLDSTSYHAAYFSRYGLRALSSSIMNLIQRPGPLPSDHARPFRICLSLMDRNEVGGFIVPEIFLPALESILHYSAEATKEQVDEVLRSASIFFNGVESGLIWGKLIYLVTSSLEATTDPRSAIAKLKLAKFIMSRFKLNEEEMLLHHLPLMILAVLVELNRTLNSGTLGGDAPNGSLRMTLEIVESLVQTVPPHAIKVSNIRKEDSSKQMSRKDISRKIKLFYEERQGILNSTSAPFEVMDSGRFMLKEAAILFAKSFKGEVSIDSPELPAKVLSVLIIKTQCLEELEPLDLVSQFRDILSAGTEQSMEVRFQQLVAITTVIVGLQTAVPSEPFFDSASLAGLLHPLVGSFWVFLSPNLPKFHVEATRCILQLHTTSEAEQCVEAAISSIICRQKSSATTPITAQEGQRFAVLWTHFMYDISLHSEKRGSIARRASGIALSGATLTSAGFGSIVSRPLLLLLDSLTDEGTELCTFVRCWLQNLPTLHKVFEIIAVQLEELNCLRSAKELSPEKLPPTKARRRPADDSRQCAYYLNHLLSILQSASHHTWATLAGEAPLVAATPHRRITFQEWVVGTCLRALDVGNQADGDKGCTRDLSRTAVTIIHRIYTGPFASSLQELEIEVPLIEKLRVSEATLQTLLLESILPALRLRVQAQAQARVPDTRAPQSTGQRPRPSLTADRLSFEEEIIQPPPQLIECLKSGLSSAGSRPVLDDWVHFLTEVLVLFSDAIFQNLLPLVECVCTQIQRTFDELKATFDSSKQSRELSPEPTLISLTNALEQLLAKAHARLRAQETKVTVNKSPEQPQGFFGNMVSGVFATEQSQTRTPTANSRLTVLLCFQDTVRICFAIWCWGGYSSKDTKQDPASVASFAYTSLRMRNRARRILEHLFAAEALECLETLVVSWARLPKGDIQASAVLGLLNVLNGSKPKHTIPAIFNAVYSRTNPNALDASRVSTLTSDLTDQDLVAFLVEYTISLEDDAMDEIWPDCMTFLRDVLANPLPHRQILPSLLEFTAVIGRKVDNTNFGEQWKMRKELSEIFTRILTAVFTTRSVGYFQEPSRVTAAEKPSVPTNGGYGHTRGNDVVSILASIVPHLSSIFVDNDRIASVVTTISQSVIAPTIRAKAFPENVSKTILDLIFQLGRVAQTNKFWRKDVADAFNDVRFFNTPLPLLKSGWLPVLAQWAQGDKERLPELLSKLSAPTTAGIMFGVGAASVRQEADRKTQLTLRRISLLLLAAPEDTFTPQIPQIVEKIVELQTATPASSPSSVTRAEVHILLRAIVVKTSSIHLAPLWPIINSELTAGLSSLMPDAEAKESYNNAAIIQICKLLDQLVVLDPDDFQLIEWLFLCDTIDAVYKPSITDYAPSLVEEVSEVLSTSTAPEAHGPVIHTQSGVSATAQPKRTLFLDPIIEALEEEEEADVTQMARRELLDRLVRPFLESLAIGKFEATYGGGAPDWEGVWDSVVADAREFE
ncbi:cellular morphogenesis regulator dopa [Sporormia fimetaria CBS 119925]|uniref:Cellular morphogenesis regulator dopa n=1 Tax=Sporormia fimetaria CBS 119925 TaxID=1340428 RepID=A0A6A6VPX5_9PLEO|nr:cellular morphogenesis regulator dopa [Sporormia fimetaria CBS 119925]